MEATRALESLGLPNQGNDEVEAKALEHPGHIIVRDCEEVIRALGLAKVTYKRDVVKATRALEQPRLPS